MINKNTDLGITANVINDGSGSDAPWRLILSLTQTGDEQLAEFPYFYFVDGDDDFQLEFIRDAKDAKVKLDGFEIELPENKAADLIPGLTIDIKKAKPGEEFTIKVSEDIEAVGAKITDLTTKLNAVLKFIKEQNTMDEKTDTSRTLGGDIMLQTLQSRIHSAVFKDVQTDGGYHRANEIGISFNREGLIDFDQKKFQAMIGKDYNTVAQILTGTYIEDEGKTQGFIDNLNETIGAVMRTPDGIVASRKKTLQGNIEAIDRRINQKQKYIEEKEKNLKDKFARLEGTISKIRSQGAGISALGAQGFNPVQELG
jgi:flagellar hook-associated protein 2